MAKKYVYLEDIIEGKVPPSQKQKTKVKFCWWSILYTQRDGGCVEVEICKLFYCL